MSGAFGLAGFYFGTHSQLTPLGSSLLGLLLANTGPRTGKKPTSATSEAKVTVAPGSMPWQTEGSGGEAGEEYKYKYHPYGNPKNAPKEAPSALHSVIVPNVNLPKVSRFGAGAQ